MTIFAVLMPTPQLALATKIASEFPSNHLKITDTQWLISEASTAADVSKRLGIADPANLSAPMVGQAIVFATSGYFGRAPQNVWDWIKIKLEARAVG